MNKIVLDYHDNEELAALVQSLQDGVHVTITDLDAQVIKNANDEIEFRVKAVGSVDEVDGDGDSDEEEPEDEDEEVLDEDLFTPDE